MSEVMSVVAIIEGEDAPIMEFKKGYPMKNCITSQLVDHANALLCLSSSDLLLMVPLKPANEHNLRYTIGDATAK